MSTLRAWNGLKTKIGNIIPIARAVRKVVWEPIPGAGGGLSSQGMLLLTERHHQALGLPVAPRAMEQDFFDEV